ncbi:zinc-binding alcohol dehydrogenase family protein [Actinoplanes sp. NPDC049596]|uniref:zinc-binding alcohol dehydrogenase family protein n=1 Tax=unclassified Actinoplanes TaxID=2626549 RepID=UPI00342CCDE6
MSETMRAVGSRDNALEDLTLPVPEPGEHDLRVRVEAVSVNPVDVKLRRGGAERVLGFDAAGVVDRVGAAVTLFRPGDQVWYAGSIARPGTDAEFHLVDERIVGPKPETLDFAEAAALPLTVLTAWEALFDRLRLTSASTGSILVLGAAGGVGSVLVQLARQLTGLEVIGTASRPESRQYVLDRGAHRVVDHHGDLRAALPDGVDYVFSPHSAGMIETFAEIVHPYGAVVAIDEPDGLDLLPLKSKSIAWHWELMFTRSLYDPTSRAQHDILRQVAELVDKGVLHTTLTERIEGIDAAGLRRAHEIVESGSAIGKAVVVRR